LQRLTVLGIDSIGVASNGEILLDPILINKAVVPSISELYFQKF